MLTKFRPSFTLMISDRKQLLIVIQYFTRYALKTKKRTSFERYILLMKKI